MSLTIRTRPGLRAALSSVRGNRPFQLLWWSNLFFFGGAWGQTLVLGWIAYDLTRSEFLVAVFTAVKLAPLLLGPLTGALADRYHRVKMLIIASGWAFVAVGAVATGASLGLLSGGSAHGMASYWAVVIGGLAIGLAQSPSQPARAALVMELVGRENLSNANALNSLAMNVTAVIGPALGGTLIATVGAPAALWISTSWYAVSLLLLLPLRQFGRPTAQSRDRVLALVGQGFRLIGRNRLALAVLLVTLAANILLWPIFQSFMPVFARELLGLDAAGLGTLLAAGGAGGLVGSVIMAGLGDFRFKGGLFVVGTAIWAGLWVLFAGSRTFELSMLLMFGIGAFGSAFAVLQTTLLLITTEPELHGRALGLQELAIGIMPISALVIGAIAQQVGVAAATVGCGLLLIVAVGLMTVRVPELLRISGHDGPHSAPARSPDAPGPAR